MLGWLVLEARVVSADVAAADVVSTTERDRESVCLLLLAGLLRVYAAVGWLEVRFPVEGC